MVGVISCAVYATFALKGGSIGKMQNDIPAKYRIQSTC
jgi:hypothetical protein